MEGDILRNALVFLFHANVMNYGLDLLSFKKDSKSIMKIVHMTHALYLKFSEVIQ